MDPVFLLQLTSNTAQALKGALAVAATLVLCVCWWASRRALRRVQMAASVMILVIAAASAAGWWNFGATHFSGGFVHIHEMFHYYMGSKYFRELGYTGLYDCTALVDVESGRGNEVARRWIRDLTTNVLRAGSPVLTNPDVCLSRFHDPARWRSFKADASWFHEHVTPQKWGEIPTDHGYNATPVWTMAGTLLSNARPVSSWFIRRLAAIDSALLLFMFGLVWWAFGWQVLCVALIWWGTNFPARYAYTGGAFLRQDWLMLSVASVCFARRGWMLPAGFTLTWAALLRVFPGFMAIGVALKLISDLVRSRSLRVPAEYLKLGLGAAVALLILVPASLTIAKGPDGGVAAWTGFVENSRKHLSTPLTNNVGLKMLVSFDPETRVEKIANLWLESPWDLWKDARTRIFAERLWLYVILVCGFLALLVWAVRDQPTWMALVLGVGTIPFLANLTCYYYCVLLVFGTLWLRYPITGIGLALLSAVTSVIPALMSQDDDRYTAISLAIVLYVVATTAWVAFRDRPEREVSVLTTSAS